LTSGNQRNIPWTEKDKKEEERRGGRRKEMGKTMKKRREKEGEMKGRKEYLLMF